MITLPTSRKCYICQSIMYNSISSLKNNRAFFQCPSDHETRREYAEWWNNTNGLYLAEIWTTNNLVAIYYYPSFIYIWNADQTGKRYQGEPQTININLDYLLFTYHEFERKIKNIQIFV